MKNTCSITDDWDYKGMKVVFLENHLLKIGILVGRGSDIFEFRYKPKDLDPLLRLSKGIRNPFQEHNQMQNPRGQFEEYYYGGWQEALPNSPVFNYRGAVLGQHGEIALLPWKYAILKNTAEEVQLKVWVELLRMPLKLEKIFTLKKDAAKLHVEEHLTNMGRTSLDIMWGQHIAFGLPFLESGAKIESNAETFTADTDMPSKRRFAPGEIFEWPVGEDISHETDNASVIPPEAYEPYSDLCYLKGYPEKAYYRLKSKSSNLSFKLNWDGNLFKCLWLWQERYATQDYPWWGDCYTVALEPWSSAGTSDPEKAIAKGEWLKLEAGEVLSTALSAEILEH